MKYLLIRKPRVGATPPSAEVVRAQKEYVQALVKEGVVDCAYAFYRRWRLLHYQRRLTVETERVAVGWSDGPVLRI